MRRQTGLELLDAEAWKGRVRAAAGEKSPTPEQLRSVAESYALMKATVTEVKKAPEDGERVREFVISDGSVDRDYDTIRPKGWDLKAYRKNPVILWAHDSRMLPLGRSVSVKVEEDQLIARAEFCPFEISPMADTVLRMLDGGYLRTASVGFRGLDMVPAQDDEERQRRYGLDFLKQELMEWSVVPVPANANALMRAHHAGINTRPIKSWAEMVLDLGEPLPGLGTNDIEAAWAAVRGPEKLYVWIEAKAEDAEPAAAPVVEPKAEDDDEMPCEEPDEDEEEAGKSAELITFRRRPDGAYTVLRSGQPVATVEQPDDVEWDEAGVISLRSAAEEPLSIEFDDPEPAKDGEADLIELEEPEPAAAVELSAEDMLRAVDQVLTETLAAVLNPRA